jgi:hypothetical protein
MIIETADALERTGLKALGWDTLQIDEGWEACSKYKPNGEASLSNLHARPQDNLRLCETVMPRDENGWIIANQTKFPGGIKPLADTLHARGFKIGICKCSTVALQATC